MKLPQLPSILSAAAGALRSLGPYLMIELLLPGGTLLALLLYLSRYRRPAALKRPFGRARQAISCRRRPTPALADQTARAA